MHLRSARALAPLLVPLILVIDAVAPDPGRHLGAAGVLDETAHLSTGLLAAAALGATPIVTAGLAAGSVLIDVDHVPSELLGVYTLVQHTMRPVTHSLPTLLLLLLLTLVARGRARAFLGGASLGLALHFVRDMDGKPGVPLLWPLSNHAVIYPYGFYVALLVLLSALSWRGSRLARRVPARAAPAAD